MTNRTIDDLRSLFQPITTSKYQVELIPPIAAPTFTSNQKIDRSKFKLTEGSYGLNIITDEVVLPGKTIATSEYTDGRQTKKIPYTFIEDEVTITFIENSEYEVRKFFDKWMRKIFDKQEYRVGYKDDFVGNVKIHQLDKTGTKVYGIELQRAYPTTITPVQLNNAGAEDLVKITVTFAYDIYSTIPIQ